MGIDAVDDGFHLCNLESVDDEIDNRLLASLVVSLGVDQRDAVAEYVRKLLADLTLFCRDNHRGFRLVKALNDEVDSLDGGTVGQNGVQRQNKALQDDAAHQI